MEARPFVEEYRAACSPCEGWGALTGVVGAGVGVVDDVVRVQVQEVLRVQDAALAARAVLEATAPDQRVVLAGLGALGCGLDTRLALVATNAAYAAGKLVEELHVRSCGQSQPSLLRAFSSSS